MLWEARVGWVLCWQGMGGWALQGGHAQGHRESGATACAGGSSQLLWAGLWGCSWGDSPTWHRKCCQFELPADTHPCRRLGEGKMESCITSFLGCFHGGGVTLALALAS